MVPRLRGLIFWCSVSLIFGLHASTGYTVNDAVFVAQCLIGYRDDGKSLYYPSKTVEQIAAGWHAIKQGDEFFKNLKFKKRATCSGVVRSYDTVRQIFNILVGLGCKSMNVTEQDDNTYRFCAKINLATLYLATGECLQLSVLKRAIECLDWDVFFDYYVKGPGERIIVQALDAGFLFSWDEQGRTKSKFFDPVTKALSDDTRYEGVRLIS